MRARNHVPWLPCRNTHHNKAGISSKQGKSVRQVKKEGGVWGRVMSPMRTCFALSAVARARRRLVLACWRTANVTSTYSSARHPSTKHRHHMQSAPYDVGVSVRINIAWREQGHAGNGWIQGKSARQVKKEGGVWGRVMSPMRTCLALHAVARARRRIELACWRTANVTYSSAR